MNGIFKVSMSTPLGTKKGTINFIDENGVLHGSITALGSKNMFKNGKASGNAFEFSGALKIGFSRFDYTAKGTVAGDTLNATAFTRYGNMQINGTRI